jgi:uncharacterized protein YjbI with pentapeptide repeats
MTDQISPQKTAGEVMEKLTQDQLDALVKLHERFLEGRIGGRRATLKRVDLSGLSLARTNLRQADFSGCMMRNMDLSNANFQEASLYACDMSFADLNNTSFVRADLRGSRIESANLAGADLERADLRVGALASDGHYHAPQSVNFKGADLSGARLVGTLANHADFSDAIMAYVNIQGADLRGASFVGADLSGADVSGVQLSGAKLDNAILAGIDFSSIRDTGYDLSVAITDKNVGLSISDLQAPLATLINHHRVWVESAGHSGQQLDLSGYDLRELSTLKKERLTAIKAPKAKFFGMNLYQIELQSALLEEADFRRCDLEGADFRGSNLVKAKFSHARLKGANFSGLMFGTGSMQRFAPCNMESAELRYADLREASFKNVSLRNADLSHADLSGADLREADLTGAILEGTVLDDVKSEGTIFPEQGNKRAFSLSSLHDDN